MILIVRLGGVEMIADTDNSDTTPTPEWCEDMTHRLARQALDLYEAVPDSRVAAPATDEDDE